MKKFLFFVLVLFNCKVLVAQKRIFEPHLKIGCSTGMAFSRVDFQPYKKQEFVSSNALNFELFYSSQPYVGIKLGFGKLEKGWKIKNDSLGTYVRKLEYYQIPFTTHIEIWQPRNFNLLIDIGPYIAFLKKETEYASSDANIEIFHGKSIDNKFEFGFIGGIGIQYSYKIHSLFLTINYLNSLTNIFNPTEDFQFFSSRNQTLTINFGYFIKLF